MNKYLSTAGEFNCLVHKPESGWFGESGVKKTPYVRLDLEVVDDPEESGSRITWYGYLSEKALEHTVAKLTETFDFNGDLNALYTGTETFDGKMCQITTEFEEYDGKDRLKVKWLNPPGYARQAQPSMDEKSLGSLLARINGKSKAAALAAKSVTKPSAKPVAAAKENGDDVPF